MEKLLTGAVSLTKNADINKYKYSGYGIGLDRRSNLSFPGGRFGQNVIIGVDMSSSTKTDNRKKDVFILGKGPIQGLEYILTTEKMRMLMGMTLCISLLVLKQINAVVVPTISIIHMQNCVFLTL